MSSEQDILKTVTVAENKGCAHILSFGGAPFVQVNKRVKSKLDPRVPVWISNGFKVRTTCSARDWELETRVLDGGAVECMCICVEHPTVFGGWQRTASKAYVKTNEELIALGLGNGKFNKKENGALLIGITYPSLQDELRAHSGAELEGAAPVVEPQEPPMVDFSSESQEPPLVDFSLETQETPSSFELSSKPEMAPIFELPSDDVTDCQDMEELLQIYPDASPLEEEPPRKRACLSADPEFDFPDVFTSQSSDFLTNYSFASLSTEPFAWEFDL